MSDTEKKSNEKSQIIPEPTKYFEFFKSAVEAYEEKGLQTKLAERPNKTPYCLYEDMKIILSFAHQVANEKTNKFKALAASSLSNRTEESIRSRHKMFLSNLNLEHLQLIVSFLSKNKAGLNGYLLPFKGDDDKINFIVSADQKITGQRQQAKQNKDNNNNSVQKQEGRIPKFLLKKRPNEKVPEILLNGRKEQKKNDQQIEEEEQKEETEIQVRKQRGLNEAELKDTRELDFYITFLANYENMQKKNMICVLDKLSGDLNQLVDFIQTKNLNLLWKDDEDKILQNFSQQTPQSIFLLKQLKKGKHNIIRRAEYLGITLPDFD